jgi:Zn-finger nucleic acid-binding protein
MNCPVCGERLREIEKYGVQIDVCPGCKGVWLDRGELEKIIDFAEKGGPEQFYTSEPMRERPREHRDEPRYESPKERDREERYWDEEAKRREQESRVREHEEWKDEKGRYGHRRKRESWLGELFDTFGGGGED